MENSKLEEIYQEVLTIRKKIEALEDLIIPTENASEDEVREIESLKDESIRGENVSWDEIKRELDL
jgi:hypothetical protein